MSEALAIRPVADSDVAALTELLLRAYRPLAEQGMHYVASYQTEDVTRRRLGRGLGYVALLGETLVGTVTLYPTTIFSECAWYQQPEVWYFGQFAVDPPYQDRGVGGALMDFAEQAARGAGASRLSAGRDSPVAGHQLPQPGVEQNAVTNDASGCQWSYRTNDKGR